MVDGTDASAASLPGPPLGEESCGSKVRPYRLGRSSSRTSAWWEPGQRASPSPTAWQRPASGCCCWRPAVRGRGRAARTWTRPGTWASRTRSGGAAPRGSAGAASAGTSSPHWASRSSGCMSSRSWTSVPAGRVAVRVALREGRPAPALRPRMGDLRRAPACGAGPDRLRDGARGRLRVRARENLHGSGSPGRSTTTRASRRSPAPPSPRSALTRRRTWCPRCGAGPPTAPPSR